MLIIIIIILLTGIAYFALGGFLTIRILIGKLFQIDLFDLIGANFGSLFCFFWGLLILFPVSIVVGIVLFVAYTFFPSITLKEEDKDRELKYSWHLEREAEITDKLVKAKQMATSFIQSAHTHGYIMLERQFEDTPLSVPSEVMGSVMGGTLDMDIRIFGGFDGSDFYGFTFEGEGLQLSGLPMDFRELPISTSVPNRPYASTLDIWGEVDFPDVIPPTLWLPFVVSQSIEGWVTLQSVANPSEVQFGETRETVFPFKVSNNNHLKIGQIVELQFQTVSSKKRRLLGGKTINRCDVRSVSWYYLCGETRKNSSYRFPVYAQLFLTRQKSEILSTAPHTDIQAEYVKLATYLQVEPIPDDAYKKWERFQAEYPDWFAVVGDPQRLLERARRAAPEILPAPFAWISIPAGRVTLGGRVGANGGYIKKSVSFDVSTFDIAKYPLTNAQYKLFIEAGGYTQDQWWTKAGLEARDKKNWTEPHFWQDAKLNQPEFPVVGVSWYEAVAYCQWLSNLTGRTIRLPTEQEWQRAAQGDDTYRVYPYGDTFDKTRCNFRRWSRTFVRQYKIRGASPFGVVDMSGNVWEWCLTRYKSGENDLEGTGVRVVKGGSSMGDIEVHLRADYRRRNDPNSRGQDRGFRLVRC